MTKLRNGMMAFVVAAAMAAPASAQVYVTQPPRAWLGISYNESAVIHNNDRNVTVTIESVSKGSPAEKAGLQAGDTIVKLNDFRATGDLLRSMGASVDAGDTVHLVVRRGGRDRNVDVVAAKRPDTWVESQSSGRVYRFDPDSVRGMMRLFVDSMYAGLDSMHMRPFRFDTAGLRNFGRFDTIFRGMADTVFLRSLPGRVYSFGHPDSVHGFMFADSVWGGRIFADSLMHMLPGMRDSLFRVMPGIRDSLLHVMPYFRDSLFRSLPEMMNDSLMRSLPRFERLTDLPPGLFEDMHTPDLVLRSFVRGESAFAGAELTNVNPDLGEYFGTRTGVLVLTVPDGTPAARAGLQAGDIVTRVDGKPVTNVTELRRTVEQAKRGAPIKLEVMRHQKAKSLELRREPVTGR